jgi:hypothetical protein
MVGKRCDALDKLIVSKIGESENKMVMKMDTNRAEFIDVRDSHDNRIT